MRVLAFRDIKNKRWTIYTPDGKTHIGYRSRLYLTDCYFLVKEDDHNQILQTGNRKPCAWIVGEITNCKETENLRTQVYFWPLNKEHHFVNDKSECIRKSKTTFLNTKGQCFIK